MGFRHLLLLALAGCASSTDDEAASGDSATTAAQVYGVFAISGDAASGHLIGKAGYQRIAIVGPRIGELVVGQSYQLKLVPTDQRVDDLATRELEDFRKVLHVAGTIADATDPASLTLTSIHAKTYALYGTTVGTYKTIRAGLPQHDYAKTLFRADVVEDLKQPGHWTWISYDPAPSYRCVEDAASQIHIDLVSVQPDDWLYDGFVVTETGGEPNYGARATCGQGTCTFDSVGSDWGKATFAPAASFALSIDRPDGSKLPFTCSAIDRSTVTSDD